MSYKALIHKHDSHYEVDAPELNLIAAGETRDEAIVNFKRSVEGFSTEVSHPVTLYIVDTGFNRISIFGSDWKSGYNLDVVATIRTHPAFK